VGSWGGMRMVLSTAAGVELSQTSGGAERGSCRTSELGELDLYHTAEEGSLHMAEVELCRSMGQRRQKVVVAE